MIAQRMRNYELVVVVTPRASDEDADATMERVNSFITERGGSVTEQDQWGMRRLAYPIDRFQEGHYKLSKFTLDPESIVELDRNLNAAEDVIRHMVMRIS